MTDYRSLHKFMESKLGRPVWTHELQDEMIFNKLKEAVKEDFLRLCEE